MLLVKEKKVLNKERIGKIKNILESIFISIKYYKKKVLLINYTIDFILDMKI